MSSGLSFIEGHVDKDGSVTVTSKHKCYKGKWYYAAKKKLAAERERVASLPKANKPATNFAADYDAAYDRGYNAALNFIREYCGDTKR